MKTSDVIKRVAFTLMCVTWSLHMLYIYTKGEWSSVASSEQDSEVGNHRQSLFPVNANNGPADIDDTPWNLADPDEAKVPAPNKAGGKVAKTNDNDWNLNNMDPENIMQMNDDNLREDEAPFIEDPALSDANQINPHHFKYVSKAPNSCDKEDVFLVVYVHSGLHSSSKRDLIRETWGLAKNYDVIVRVVFVMGIDGQDMSVNNQILQESETYGDIVQEDFVDNYRNQTYKGIAGLRWVYTNCRNAKFVMKTDDATFVNMPALLQHLKDLESNKRQWYDFIMCRVWWKMHVLRGKDKWSVLDDEYPLPFYPPYCSSLAFIFTTKIALQIYEVSYTVPFFWVDDVYISGMLPYVLDYAHIQFIHTYIKADEMDKFMSPTWYKYIFASMNDEDDFMYYWKRLQLTAKKFPIPEVEIPYPGLVAGNNQTSLLETPSSESLKVDFDKYLEMKKKKRNVG